MNEKTPDFEEIFHAALEMESPSERAEFLQSQCGDDKQLLSELQEMLASLKGPGSSLDKATTRLDETIIPTSSGDDLAASLDAGLATAFSANDAVVIGDANHSVLKMLGNTLNEVPRVSLRESEAEGADPIARPASPEIPHHDSDSRYRLDGEIARGGMGAIIKGRDTDLGRDLAIKVLLDSHKDKPEVVQRFVEEAQIGGQLQHPGIAPIYELGQFADKRPFFAMKLVKGQTLSKLLADREDATADRGKLIGIFEQICQTMAYAHSRGVIHRDLKPANIMVGAFGEVQVMDWGLAKVLQTGGVADEKKSQHIQQGQSIIQTMRSSVGSDLPDFGSGGSVGTHTQMGSVMGTPAYMAPEQALGEIDQMNERADVFGLGAILCEILTGQPPYVADDGTRVFRMASRGKLGDAFSRLGDCDADEDLIALTKHCLELEPVDRPRDAEMLAERVTGYLESVEEKLREAEVQRASEAARADAESAQAEAERQRAEAQSARAEAESKRRRTSLMLAASVLLLVSLSSGGWLYMERQEANRQTAEADAQRQHAVEMQTLAEQRDEQRKTAELARKRSFASQKIAEEEKLRADETLADMYTARGFEAGRDGDSATAALWFSHAALSLPNDTNRLAANQIRARNWLNNAVVPAAKLKAPAGPLQRLSFQPNGELALTLNGTHLRVWDWRYEIPLAWSESRGDILDAVWSPDGTQLALATNAKVVQIVEPVSGNSRIEFPASDQLQLLEWSPDGTRIATAGKRVQIWNVSDGPTMESDWQHPALVCGLTFNGSGTRLVTACKNGTARLFATNDATLPAPIFDPISCVARVRQLQMRGALTPVFYDDDRQLVTIVQNQASGSMQPAWWDVETGLEIRRELADDPESDAMSLDVSSDGRWLAVGGLNFCRVWSVDGEFSEFKSPVRISRALFHPHSNSLMTTCWDENARLWPTPDLTSSPISFPTLARFSDCAFSHEGQYAAIANVEGVVVWKISRRKTMPRGIQTWKASGMDSLRARDTAGRGRPRLSFDGRLVTLGRWFESRLVRVPLLGRTVSVASMADGLPAGPEISVDGDLRDSCICADNRTVAAIYTDGQAGSFAAFNVATGSPNFDPIRLPSASISVAPRPGHSQVAVLCEHGELFVVDVDQGSYLYENNQKRAQKVHRGCQVTWSPDGESLVAFARSGEVSVLDAQTFRLRYAPLKPGVKKGFCTALDISPDSRLLATGWNNSEVSLWDLITGQRVASPLVHPDHTFGIPSVAFSPDGKQILTGHADGQLRLWDWQTGQLVVPPMQNAGEALDALFTQDGRYAVVVVRDPSMLNVWDLSTAKLAVPSLHRTNNKLLNFGMTQEQVVLSTPGYPLLDLSPFLEEPDNEANTLLHLAELSTNSAVQLGEPGKLTTAEWDQRWDAYVAAARPIADNTSANMARRLDEAENIAEREQIARRAVHKNILEQLIALRPDVPQLHLALADGRARQQDTVGAIAAYRRAIELDSTLVSALARFRHVLEDAGQNEKAIAVHEILAAMPKSPKAHMESASTLYKQGQQDKAIAEFRKAFELRPNADSFFNNAAWLLVANPDDEGSFPYVQEAVEWARRANELSPNDGFWLNTLGVALYRDEQWKAAIEALQKSIELGTDLPSFEHGLDVPHNWLFLAMAYWQLGQKDKARRWYDKSLAWQTANAAAAKADTELQGFFAEAARMMTEVLEDWLDDQNTDVSGLSQLAAIHLARGQFDVAKAEWLRVVQLEPQQLLPAFNAFRKAERWSSAAEFGQQLIAQNPEDSSRWIHVAPVVVFSGDEELYAKFCQSMLQRRFTTHEPAERAIKVCLLRAGAVDISDLPEEILATALDKETAPAGFRPWGWATRALLAYRSSDAKSAVKYVAKSEANQPVEFTQTMNQAVLAMAHHNLDQPNEAKVALEKASELITTLNKAGNKGASDLLIAEILFREADAKINSK